MTADAATIIPVIRGLLAEASGDEDRPYCNVILEALTDEAAMDFASSPDKAAAEKWPAPPAKGSPPPLHTDATAPEALGEAVGAFALEHGVKPAVVCLPGLGVLRVVQPAGRAEGPLGDRVALVTGAAGAIGFGICRRFLEAGARVAATDLPGERLDRLVAELGESGPRRVMGAAMDVTDPASVAGAFAEVARRWGGVDLVVVNAGIAMVSPLLEMDLDAFRKLEKVNVEGALLTLAEAGRQMKRQGTGGDIVVVSTKNVPCPGAGFGAYSSTKAACHQLGRIASLELAEYDIRVNMVAPDAVFSGGEFKSGLWEEVGPGRMQARGLDEHGLHEYYRNRNLLKARVTARHVANAALFFATRQTPTTGATIPVDGGLPDATPR